MMPTGNSKWRSQRPIVSHPARKIAPENPVEIIKNRWSGPAIIRATCGTSNPTNPIGPAAETIAPTTNEVTMNQIVRNFPTLTPSDVARSLPVTKTFIVRDCRIKNSMNIKTIGVNQSQSAIRVAFCTPPIVQRRICRASCGAERYCSKTMRLEKKKFTAIPARSICSLDVSLRRDRARTIPIAKEAPRNAPSETVGRTPPTRRLGSPNQRVV